MGFKIEFSETCLEEIEHICKYIEIELRAKEAANNLRRKIIEKIGNLKMYPKLYMKIPKTDRIGREYRRIVINNFVILYTIIEEDNCILISHMYYGGKNYINGVFAENTNT